MLVNVSIIKYPKSDETGIFLMMFDSPLPAEVENDDKLGECK